MTMIILIKIKILQNKLVKIDIRQPKRVRISKNNIASRKQNALKYVQKLVKLSNDIYKTS